MRKPFLMSRPFPLDLRVLLVVVLCQSVFVFAAQAAEDVLDPDLSSNHQVYNYYNIPEGSPRIYVDQVIGRHYLRGARKQFARRDFDYAWQELNYVFQRVPNHPDSLLVLTQLMRELPKNAPDFNLKLSRAQTYFKNALTVDPKQSNTHVLYGMFLQIDPTSLNDAITEYETAIKLNPRHTDAYYNLGLALVERHDYENALNAAKKAYALGHPLPGLRKKLQAVNAWK